MPSGQVKFISYDGAFPNLCSGKLILEVNGKKVEFPNYCLCSGGSVSFSDDWEETVTQGEWRITDFPKDFPENLKTEAEDIVNENVRWGCCGGCV